MSHLPKTSSSTATLIETGRRVCRLCDREGNGTQKYATQILQAENKLSSIAEKTRLKTFERIANYDALVFTDTQLDDAIRSTFFACRKHDWQCGGAPILEKVFPNGVISPIIQAPRNQEHERVTRMLACLSTIVPEGSELASAATELETALKQVTTAQEVFEKSALEESKLKALENLGKKEYIEQYSAIYHQACGDLSRNKANRLFPAVDSSRKKTVQFQENMVQPMSATA